jgi:TRAP-type C4-dicarboxylate transport system substrate-binding protein
MLGTACAPKAPATTSPTAPVAKPAEIINIKMGGFDSAGVYYEVVDEFGKMLNYVTDGRFTPQLMAGETVAPFMEQLNATRDGIYDTNLLWEASYSETVPWFSVIGLASYLLKDSFDVYAITYNQPWDWNSLRTESYGKLNCVFVGVGSFPGNGMFSNKPVNSLADLKGLKIATGGTGGQSMQKLGAEAISLTNDEMYTAMSSGLIDAGVYAAPPTWVDVGITEVSKYWLDPVTMPTCQTPVIANKDFWNRLSVTDQRLFKEISNWVEARKLMITKARMAEALKTAEQDYGITICHWSEADWKTWRKLIIENQPRYPDDPTWQKAFNDLMDYATKMAYLD